MAKYNLDNYTSADGLGFPLNFRRGNPNPLDNSSVWASKAAAEEYAKTDPTAYVGQILSVVVKNGNTFNVSIYVIQDETGTLADIVQNDTVAAEVQAWLESTAGQAAITVAIGDNYYTKDETYSKTEINTKYTQAVSAGQQALTTAIGETKDAESVINTRIDEKINDTLGALNELLIELDTGTGV